MGLMILPSKIRPFLVALLSSVCLAQAPIGPHSAFELPVAKAAASLEEYEYGIVWLR